jgi:hypothetical protein
MSMNRLFLAAAALLSMGTAALAQDSCTPVETAPGIKSIPAGCNKVRQARTGQTAPQIAPSPKSTPDAKPSALFPGTAPGSIAKYGDTEVRVGGSVRFEYGYGR